MFFRTGSNMPWFASRTCAALFVILVLGCTSSAAQTAAPAPPPIGAVLREIPPDLWHFISWDTGAVLGIGGAAALVGHVWDDDLADEIETAVTFNNAMAPGHTYGAFTVQALVGVGLYAGGWFAKKERLARTGGDIMRAQVLSQVYVQAIKYTAQRERPDQSDHRSFPSGHSASAFATAGVLQRHYGWKAGVPATVVAAYVATARVHDNRHHLSDVIFGAAMGIAAERTVTLNAGRYRVTLAPAAGAARAGVVAVVH
jgi:membrane-associated phospholipid phosphatase